MIYAQVIEDFGWDSMRNVMTSYETGDSATYPTSEQGIIDFFWSQYSLQVEVDLSELLQKWDIPFTSDFTSRVEGLPAYVERVNLFAPWLNNWQYMIEFIILSFINQILIKIKVIKANKVINSNEELISNFSSFKTLQIQSCQPSRVSSGL